MDFQDVPILSTLLLSYAEAQSRHFLSSSLLRENQMKEDSIKLGQEVKNQEGILPSTRHPA